MHFNKKYLFFSSTLFLLFATDIVFAQLPPGMRQVYANMNNQFINQRMMSMQMMNLNRYSSNENQKYDFTVLMKDSSKLEVSSKMYNDTSRHKNYLLLVDKKYPKNDSRREQKIYPDQTFGISRKTSIYYEKGADNKYHLAQISGNPTDSCWFFKSIEGKINAYSYLSETDKTNSYITPDILCAIQLDDGPIVKLNAAALTAIVGQNEDVLAFIKKEKYYKAIKRFNKDFEKANKK
jgi:hypothetical protein